MRDVNDRLKKIVVPEEVTHIMTLLKGAGYRAFIVGGAVRDFLMGKTPADFDIATDARPENVQHLFDRSIPVGKDFGTILIPIDGRKINEVHVTTFRSDLTYRDGRRPEGVLFTSSITDDLARRDFTINAMAWDPGGEGFIDPFGGRQDLDDGLIRAVGRPELRMREDALRTLRAVRFAARLNFHIDLKTWRAIETHARQVRRLSGERIRDELLQILGADDAGRGLWMMVELGLFFIVFAELKGSDRMLQAKRDAPTLLDHLIQTAAHCPPDPILRLAGLLHDVGKLTTRTIDAKGRVRFYGHARVGETTARAIGRRLRLPKRDVHRIGTLVRMHMAFSTSLEKKTIRRWVGRYGKEWVSDLIALGRADWGASGWRGDIPNLDAVQQMLDEVVAEEHVLRPSDLAVDGFDIMEVTGWSPGRNIGRVMQKLYDLVLENPELNDKERLLAIVRDQAASWTQ